MVGLTCRANVMNVQVSPVMKANTPLEQHASEVYMRAMFKKFGEVLYEAGR